MNPPSVDIVDMLEMYGDSSGTGLSFKTNLFVGKEPNKPDDCVTIFDTPGFPPALGLTDQGYEYPSVEILVRSRDYLSGWDLANRIKDALHGRNHETWNGTLYTVISCVNGPNLLDWDDNGRVHFSINFNIQRHN